MNYPMLPREEICRVIEGRGNARRIPALFHFWMHLDDFGDKAAEVRSIMDAYPQDVQKIQLRVPDVYQAPADDPSYRWSYMDQPATTAALDQAGFIEDWDVQMESFLADFPSAEYPGLIPASPPRDGRYRLGYWWYFYFERFWSIRGMQDTLMDFYLYPDPACARAGHAFLAAYLRKH